MAPMTSSSVKLVCRFDMLRCTVNTVLLLFGCSYLMRGYDALTIRDKSALFENCSIFNESSVYGGEVCGDNGQTYANSLFLDCLNHHNSEEEEVATLHAGPCVPNEQYCSINLYYDPVCGSDKTTYSNVQSLLCHRHKQSKQTTVASSGPCEVHDYCYREGTAIYGSNPVCGSNGLTYQNPAQVKCMQEFNDELKILYDGGCHVDLVHDLHDNETICKLAKTRYEWNPVCASDGMTYPNPFVFLCYHPHLSVISNGECDTISHDACVIAHANTTLLENGVRINHAFTPEDEVCGSDGRTYGNIHQLHCHTRANKYLFLRHKRACAGPDDNPCGSIPEEQHRMPVCGTNGRSYVSPEALWCAKLRSPEQKLAYMHDGPC